MESINIAKTITSSFLALPDAELNKLGSIIENHRLMKGEILLGEGQIARHIFYVESGMLRQFYYKDGRDITEHFTCEGFITFCITSLFRGVPTQLMIEAIEPSCIYSIPYQKLDELSIQYPLFAKLKCKILEYSLILSQQKADSWRFETVRERYERFVNEFPEAAKRASINHIASYLLMTPESLSRIRSGSL
ncbi:MAG: Crp/Fnr family transcriptional regulator [Prevotella sp.]|jgi:CRP-like cAMP-binding protein|nr:Crp/Fnr family transcriptional regulator [Prevotella sp.]